MEPENTQQETVVQNQFNEVTPLSRYLALVLFIILPFLGGWIGYTFAPEKVVEVDKLSEVTLNIEADDDVILSSYSEGYSGNYGNLNNKREDIYLKLAESNDGKRSYFLKLAHGNYSKLYFTLQHGKDNGFDSGWSIWEIKNAGLVNPVPWRVSPSDRYVAMLSYSDDALPYCISEGAGQKYVSNVLQVLDLDTGEVKIYATSTNNIGYTFPKWSEVSDQIIVGKESYSIMEYKDVSPEGGPGSCADTGGWNFSVSKPAELPGEVFEIQ